MNIKTNLFNIPERDKLQQGIEISDITGEEKNMLLFLKGLKGIKIYDKYFNEENNKFTVVIIRTNWETPEEIDTRMMKLFGLICEIFEPDEKERCKPEFAKKRMRILDLLEEQFRQSKEFKESVLK